ncbi:MAG TPA: HAD-IA family hydrolase [Pseudonocardiaceae bacterium]|jgi:FMN phosphatase YigB (HAD superfamily)|nr:HAD-IA family hydrolase [Pseudonocardiaceae bacterium]
MLRGLIVDFGGVITDPDGGDRIVAAVAAARAHGLRTGLLSNADNVDDLDDLVAGIFDDILLAGRVGGFGKPDIRVYLLAADRLGLAPEECVFVDDVAAFVHGAVRAGMVGVHHHDVDTTLTELTALFGPSAGPAHWTTARRE